MRIKRNRAAQFALYMGVFMSTFIVAKADDVVVSKAASGIKIENQTLSVQVALKEGTYSAIRKRDKLECLSDVSWSVNEIKSTDGYTFEWKEAKVADRIGNGKELCLTGSKPGSLSLILTITLYEDQDFIALSSGVVNTSDSNIQIVGFSPLTGLAYRGASFDEFKMLDGESGEYVTRVITSDELSCFNNLLATFGRKGEPKSNLVIGGLGYHEFVKHAQAKKSDNVLEISVFADDPVGKLVDAGSTYLFDRDRFYIDFVTPGRFESLEKYGLALRSENNVKLDKINYPGLNFWYCMNGAWGGDEFRNTSTGILEALKLAKETGLLKYSPLAVRLEPDDYSKPNNQQGWWDNEHWQMYESGKLVAPYETIEKWGNAVTDMGGIPFIYCQTAMRSQDYCDQFPEHILFNESNKERSQGKMKYAKGDYHWSYDFTDPGFIKHMEDVYANLRKGGVKAMKFDYPDNGWAYDGGMEDKYATTASAYRNIFRLAYEGLGIAEADIHERLPMRGDICLGVITTHRTEGDTDRYFPNMARKCGLRWYKNRIVTKYVNDVFNPFHAFPLNRDGVRTMFTMSFLTNGRMEIGKYIEKMTDEHRYDLSRVLPLYSGEKSSRPVDAFGGGDYVQIFDLEINPKWHQIAFYNTQIEKDPVKGDAIWQATPKEPYKVRRAKPKKLKDGTLQKKEDRPIQNGTLLTDWPLEKREIRFAPRIAPIPALIGVEFGDPIDDGGLGLLTDQEYYVYDFWNDKLVGKLSGKERLEQTLRASETRVMSIHEVEPNPQFISTDRHVMQGYLDFEKVPEWNTLKMELTGTSKVIADDVYTVVIALNGYTFDRCTANKGTVNFKLIDTKNEIGKLTISTKKNESVTWNIIFRK